MEVSLSLEDFLMFRFFFWIVVTLWREFLFGWITLCLFSIGFGLWEVPSFLALAENIFDDPPLRVWT
jgi:hypothetical protein